MDSVQFFEMMIGDLTGAFIGVLILKIITELSFFKRKLYSEARD
jgi:hypothetical protein